ncbi:MAG: hypothetical protein JW789_01640 [Candidatus Aenigmarchaeota archaeon]|nr:hypothetical protein [Candidatus Aenigmarchaeota archaeon]
METITICLAASASVIFLAAAVYIHKLRKRSESVFPAPFLNPQTKRKPKTS